MSRIGWCISNGCPILWSTSSKPAPYHASIAGVVVESTFNWYWLVDGLMEAGYRVHLANTAAIQQYAGLKHTDDHSDARWLAHMLRLGLLPKGYIYPKEVRPVRDLLRKRSQLVRHQTAHLLSIQNLVARNTGASINGNGSNNGSGTMSCVSCPMRSGRSRSPATWR
jgi:Transposase